MSTPARRIDARDLGDAAAQLVRDVIETGDELVVTIDGEPVAVLRRFTSDDPERARERLDEAEALARFAESSRLVTAAWKSELSAVEAVNEQRRSFEPEAAERAREWPDGDEQWARLLEMRERIERHWTSPLSGAD